MAYNSKFTREQARALAITGIVKNRTKAEEDINANERDRRLGRSIGTKCGK